MTTKFAAYKEYHDANPDAFLEGVVSFCKKASDDGTGKSMWQRIWPWLVALGGGYLAMKAGEGWGRYAQQHDNPAGPIKGAFGEIVTGLLPKGEHVVWPGSKEYDEVMEVRRAQDDARWNRLYGNSVAEGRAKSLTMR